MGLRSRKALLNRGKKSRGVAGGAGLGLGERLKPKDLNRQGSQSRVVAHLRNGQLLKGYASLLPQNDPDAVLKDRSVALPAIGHCVSALQLCFGNLAGLSLLVKNAPQVPTRAPPQPPGSFSLDLAKLYGIGVPSWFILLPRSNLAAPADQIG